MIDLSPTQAASRITVLLAAPENRTLDFKRISAKHGRMIETVCAFANTEGGLLVIGVGDAKDLKTPKARNPLIAQNLREFPVAPNIDAGEGVKMMFAEMAAAQLYPPQYSQNLGAAVESVTVTLLNLERPSVWDEVSDWVDRHGSIQNAKLCEIAKMDTLKASKLLTAWREQGLLVPLPDRAKKNMAYTKPTKADEQPALFSDAEDNKF
jgi:predicted HTH transcriptional regulator